MEKKQITLDVEGNIYFPCPKCGKKIYEQTTYNRKKIYRDRSTGRLHKC
jgi:hypothetical protein